MGQSNDKELLSKIKVDLNGCSYEPKTKNYVSKMFLTIMKFPEKNCNPLYFIKEVNQNKIVMVWYPMSVSFMCQKYNVPIQICIMKNITIEPHQIFLKVPQNVGVNRNNKDIF